MPRKSSPPSPQHPHQANRLLPQLICSQPPIESNDTPNTNTCDADNLTYDCECANGMQPNITQYTQTLPFFICQEWGNQCEKDCGDSTCASECRQKHPCGAQDPFKPNSSTISRTMSTSATASRTGVEAGATTNSDGETIFTGFGGASSTGDSGSAQESAASDSAGGRAAALEFGQTFGFVALAGAFFGGMALVL